MKNNYIKYGLLAIVILLAGSILYYFVYNSNKQNNPTEQTELYTCPMHPEIIRNAPGNCPICGMELVKKVTEKQTVENHSIKHLLKSTNQFVVGDFDAIRPKDTVLSAEIYLPGVITYDPNSAVNIVARVSGRIEKMYVNYKFQKVNKGQKMFDLYSPELLTEQQNFIYLISNDAQNSSIIKASKQKLLLYGMTENQISSLAAAKKTNPLVTVYSTADGLVQGMESVSNGVGGMMGKKTNEKTELSLKEGDYIRKNEVVFKLLNTDKVWAVFNVMQGDAALVRVNNPIRFSTELSEKEYIKGKVDFVETHLNETDKTNRIRVYLDNRTSNFPIGLRLQAYIKTDAIKGIWIPKEALVNVGTKKVAFVKIKNGFHARAIQTGLEIGNYIQILSGTTIDDEIVANAQYLMDSESFIKTE